MGPYRQAVASCRAPVMHAARCASRCASPTGGTKRVRVAAIRASPSPSGESPATHRWYRDRYWVHSSISGPCSGFPDFALALQPHSSGSTSAPNHRHRLRHMRSHPFAKKGAEKLQPGVGYASRSKGDEGSRQTTGPKDARHQGVAGYRNGQEETITNWQENPNSHPKVTSATLASRQVRCYPPSLPATLASGGGHTTPLRAVAFTEPPLRSVRTPAVRDSPENRYARPVFHARSAQ